VLQRLAGSNDNFAALTERSMMISADNAHGIHPNYADRHDENHGPLLNRGPVIKINANQRYASNSETSGLFRMLAEAEEVAVQSFVVRTDMACGSTIGPITAGGVGVRTLDIGVPTFAMHSVRELAGTRDAWDLCRVLQRFYDYDGVLAAT
jgi:aspartyl aminopeptidase